MPEPIRVIITGALGRMGREMATALAQDPDIDLVGGVAPHADSEEILLGTTGRTLPLARELEPLLARTDVRVLVDFTRPEAVMANVRLALKHRVSPVVGTTGLSQRDLEEIGRLAEEAGVGAVVASNFAVGANLMIYFARLAARYMPHAEIIELHHDAKADAPSGTALSTARAMRAARGEDLRDAATSKFTLEGVRGGELGGIRIHSVRLPGYVAHQEVIFGGQGQTLTIRHDSTSRESFAPGVALAVKAVVNQRGLVVGLDAIMGLE